MRNLSFSLFNVVSIALIILLRVLIIVPFNLGDVEQAQRIAKWINVYERVNYSFDLFKIHNGAIVPDLQKKVELSEDVYLEMLVPYLNVKEDSKIKKHKYRLNNGRGIEKHSQFYFSNFKETKDGCYISIRERQNTILDENRPLYYMFIDINGKEKPNRVGQDIFFINIYKDKISAVGDKEKHAKLKANCSPIGTGFYCSEYYLHSGSL